AHADADVQPFVAIDEIVTAAALDDVAAATAENDVARTERGHAGAEELIEHPLQDIDQRDVGEYAAQGTVREDRGRVGIIAAQEVAERRSRQALGKGEAIENPGV